MEILIKWFINALALWFVAAVIPGIKMKGFGIAFLIVIVIGLLNALLKPVLIILTLPINIVTLGLFTFIINAFLFKMAGSLSPSFQVKGFLPAFLGAIFFSIISTMLNFLIG